MIKLASIRKKQPNSDCKPSELARDYNLEVLITPTLQVNAKTNLAVLPVGSVINQSTEQGMTWKGAASGISINFGASGGMSSVVNVNNPWSVAARVFIDTLGATQCVFCDHILAGSQLSVQLITTTGNKWHFGVFNSSFIEFSVEAGTVTTGWHDIVAISSGGSNYVLQLYVDGILLGTNAASTLVQYTVAGATARFMSAGAYLTGAGFQGNLLYGAIFQSDITALVQPLKNNPWQLFSTNSSFIYFDSITGIALTVANLLSNTTFTASDLVQQNVLANANLTSTQTLGTPTLVQQNILTNSNLMVTQTLSTVTLTQANILSLLNLLSTTQLGTLDLVQQNLLNVLTLLSTQSLEQITLSVQGTLELNNLLTDNILTSPDLIQQNILALDNISQATALTTLTLSLAGILALNNLLSTVSYSAVALTQQNVLVLDNVTDNTLVTAINLIQQNNLVLANIVTNTTTSNVDLTQQNVLVVTNNYNGTTLDNVVLSTIPLLNISNVFSTETLANINLTSSSTLIVDSVLHNTITTHLRLSLGANLLEGNFIYMLGKNSNIYVVKSMKDIYIIN